MARFKITQTQYVTHVYTWEVDAEDQFDASETTENGIPDNAKEETSITGEDTEVACLHNETYIDDKMQTVCSHCQFELGR